MISFNFRATESDNVGIGAHTLAPGQVRILLDSPSAGLVQITLDADKAKRLQRALDLALAEQS